MSLIMNLLCQKLSLIDFISVLGFIIAVYTFYQTQLKKGKVQIVPGPSINIYYAPGGGSCFYIPIAFINENDKSGKVINVSLRIITPSNKKYRIRWADFVKYNSEIKGYNHLDHARAFSVPGQSVIDKFVWFAWRDNNKQKLKFEIGNYNAELILDNSTVKTFKLKKFPFKFKISEDDFAFLKAEQKKNSGGTRVITLNQYEKENLIE